MHMTIEDMDVLETGFRGRLEAWKARGLSKVDDVRQAVADRSALVRIGAESQVTKLQGSMRGNPMKWAAIAAGTGFALGMIGRLADARRKRNQMMPTLVIVKASC